MKLSKNENGFSIFEAVLVLAIVILIGAVAFLIHKNNYKNSTKSSASTSSSVKSASMDQVKNLLKDFYNQYTNCVNRGNLNQTCTTNLVKQDGTPELYSYYKPSVGNYDSDPIECAQDTPNEILTPQDVSVVGSSASGVISDYYSGSGYNDILFTAIKQGSAWKINTVTCNPPVMASTVPE